MRFSIIIPTFNRAHLLDQAIQSALAQTHTDREILIVDDGSSDHTQVVASNYGEAVRYLRQENSGKADALNRGVAASTGEAVIVLDDDDLFPRWALARHADALARDPSADFSYGRYVRFTGSHWPSPSDLREEEYFPRNDPRRLAIKLMEKCFLPNPAWAVRRQALLRAGPYDERLKRSQDYDMILRLAGQNEGVFVDDIVLLQRQHEAYRGPASERALTVHSISAWIKYDALLFENIAENWALSDFRPFHDSASSEELDTLPSLQKGVILFQRKVYEGARLALNDYRRTLENRAPSVVEKKIASGLLGCCHGIEDVVDSSPSSDKIVNSLRAQDWPISIRMAFASQMRWRVRNAIACGDLTLARKIVRFTFKAFGLTVTLTILGSRYDAGLRSWSDPPAPGISHTAASFLLQDRVDIALSDQ